MTAKRIRLRLVGGGAITLDHTVPATRAECPTQRPCPHYRCRLNLANEHDDGRTWYGIRYRLRAYWLENTQPVESCALDLAESARTRQRGMTSREIAAAMGRHPTRVRMYVREALRSLKAAGVDVREMEALIDDEEQRERDKGKEKP